MVEVATIVHTAGGLVTGAGLALSDTWQAVLGDRIAAWRLANAAKLQQKVAAELKAAGVTLNHAKVPDRYAFAWFEEATKHDEDELQSLFAKLLAQAAAGNADASDRRHLAALTLLTPPDAALFKSVYASARWHMFVLTSRWEQTWGIWQLETAAKEVAGDGGQKALEHLINVGLLSPSYELDTGSISGAISYALRHERTPDLSRLKIKEQVTSTALGVSLYLALYPEALDQPKGSGAFAP
jgi:hypothetical protein